MHLKSFSLIHFFKTFYVNPLEDKPMTKHGKAEGNIKNKTEIRNLPIDENGFFNFDDFNKLVNDKTKLVSLSHALYNTGAILPIEKVGKILDNKVPFFVDSAQTVGCIDNLSVKNLKCDFMAFNGSKWLCGPMGTGLFYCSRNAEESLKEGA